MSVLLLIMIILVCIITCWFFGGMFLKADGVVSEAKTLGRNKLTLQEMNKIKGKINIINLSSFPGCLITTKMLGLNKDKQIEKMAIFPQVRYGKKCRVKNYSKCNAIIIVDEDDGQKDEWIKLVLAAWSNMNYAIVVIPNVKDETIGKVNDFPTTLKVQHPHIDQATGDRHTATSGYSFAGTETNNIKVVIMDGECSHIAGMQQLANQCNVVLEVEAVGECKHDLNALMVMTLKNQYDTVPDNDAAVDLGNKLRSIDGYWFDKKRFCEYRRTQNGAIKLDTKTQKISHSL